MSLTRRIAAVAAVVIATAPILAAQAAQQRTPAPSGAKLTGTMAAVQGTWQMTNVNGQDTAGSGQEIVITITDNKYVNTLNGQVVERGTFKIDDTKKPMTLDITIAEGDNAGQTQLGVFELVAGKTMNGKLGNPGGTARPTDFSVAEGFFVFKMVKK